MSTPQPRTLASFVRFPENRSALAAIEQLAGNLGGESRPNQLFLHGPPGSGKTHLTAGLVHKVSQHSAAIQVTVMAARDMARDAGPSDSPHRCDLRRCALLIVEDLQHLAARAAEALVQTLDCRRARRLPTVMTAALGPQELGRGAQGLPARLTSRLVAGLAIGLQPLSAASRLCLLRELAQRRQLALSTDVLVWLSENLSGARQLEGALNQLELLARGRKERQDLAAVMQLFRDPADPERHSIDSITRRVGEYFQLEPERMQSRYRGRNIAWPRQVSMYLARQLTRLSLGQIGKYFGRRDHTTVLYACRKVEKAITDDALARGAVCQLQADLA